MSISIPDEFIQQAYKTSTIELPKGSFIEICGDPGTGKTSYVLSLIKELQDNYDRLNVAYIDVLKDLSFEYIESYQINKNRLMLAQPYCLSECKELVKELTSSFVEVIIIDSLSFFHVNDYKEYDEFFTEILPLLTKTNSTIILINKSKLNLTKKYLNLSFNLSIEKKYNSAYGYKGLLANIDVLKFRNNYSIAKQIKIFFGSHVELIK